MTSAPYNDFTTSKHFSQNKSLVLGISVSSPDKLLHVVLLPQRFIYTVSNIRMRGVRFSTTAQLFTEEKGKLPKSLRIRCLSAL